MRSSDSDRRSVKGDESANQRFNTRLGLALFGVYVASYMLLICISANSTPSSSGLMSSAFANGFVLVVMAVGLSVTYKIFHRGQQRTMTDLAMDSVHLRSQRDAK